MISVEDDKCARCGGCVGVCPFDALFLRGSIEITEDCTDCMICVDFCPTEALH